MAKTKTREVSRPASVDPRVAQVFDSYPGPIRKRLLELRALILRVAEETDGVGAIEETLKWNQPSYLTPESGSGTTIRIDALGSGDTSYAMFVHCQTTLVEDWKERYGELFEYDGTRALHFDLSKKLPKKELENCVCMALTYHLRKKTRTL